MWFIEAKDNEHTSEVLYPIVPQQTDLEDIEY